MTSPLLGEEMKGWCMNSSLSSLLNTFHTSILDDNATPSLPLIKPNGRIAASKQLAIYIEGYRIRLIHAIRSDYPALLALLGEQEFDRLALNYINNQPPTHFNLDRYPHGFTAFIRHDIDAFATDVATLETAIAEVFMLEESTPLEPSALTSLTPEALGQLTLTPRTASRLLHLAYPAEAFMMECREGHTPAPPAPETNYLYLVRHHNEVKRYPLSQAEYLILKQFYDGKTISDALDSVSETHPELLPEIAANLQSWFARWAEHTDFFKPSRCRHKSTANFYELAVPERNSRCCAFLDGPNIDRFAGFEIGFHAGKHERPTHGNLAGHDRTGLEITVYDSEARHAFD